MNVIDIHPRAAILLSVALLMNAGAGSLPVVRVCKNGASITIIGVSHRAKDPIPFTQGEWVSSLMSYDKYWFEVDESTTAKHPISGKLLLYNAHPTGVLLSNNNVNYVSTALFGSVEQKNIERVLSMSLIDIYLLLQFKQENDGLPTVCIDCVTQRQVINNNKNIGFFETTEEQFIELNKLTSSAQKEMVVNEIRHPGLAVGEERTIERLWSSGKVKLASSDMRRMSPYSISEFWKKLVTERNLRMSSILDRYTRPGNTLVVIGMAHLMGHDSLQNILMRKGYKTAFKNNHC